MAKKYDFQNLSDEELFQLTLERSPKNHNNYTAQALAAQKEYQERRGGFQTSIYNSLVKKDRSCYETRYH